MKLIGVLHEMKKAFWLGAHLREFYNVIDMIRFVEEFDYIGKCKIVSYHDIDGLGDVVVEIKSDKDIIDTLEDFSKKQLNVINIVKM